MNKLRIGAPGHLAARPLVFGLMRNSRAQVDLVYDEPGRLATALDRRELDAALIPSIEFLRGTGGHYVQGPAQIAGVNTRSLVLVTDRDLPSTSRIAVNENSRTPLAVLRIVLDKLHHTTPDFCVFKGDPDKWCEAYDGVLLTGDRGLDHWLENRNENAATYDLGEMWAALFPHPLVLSLWAYNDEKLGERLQELLVSARDFGIQNLSILSDGVAQSSSYDGEVLYNFFATSWKYDLGRAEEQGLKVLEQHALEYQLIQHSRLGKVLAV
ncbi:MAG: MqnA/MqnD/SBP family protein [Candidatus Krumholzibacteriia bacterium]